jgi:hypothetical protein
MEENFRVLKVNTWQYKMLEWGLQRLYIEKGKSQTILQCQKEDDDSVTWHFVSIHL